MIPQGAKNVAVGLIKYVALPKALNEAWLIFQVLMVRIHFPPAVSQGRTRPRGLALLEATIVSERPMMGVFNNLVVFDQHVKQNSLNSIVPDLADEVGPTLLQRQRERSRPAGPCQRS